MNKNLPFTEFLNEKLPFIDRCSTIDGLNILVNDQLEAITAVKSPINSIKLVVDKIFNHLKNCNTSRLVYCGAGTSGRIGVQDGAELYPTFGWPKSRFDFIIAGGKEALTESIEDAEDNQIAAEELCKKKNISKNDIIIGISASGNTPFTSKVILEASKVGALTIGISNNPLGEMLKYSNFNIILDTKYEIVAGSTRLKAGTSQKVCLNLISTMLMVKLGRVKNGRMISMVANNAKLRFRKSQIIKNL